MLKKLYIYIHSVSKKSMYAYSPLCEKSLRILMHVRPLFWHIRLFVKYQTFFTILLNIAVFVSFSYHKNYLFGNSYLNFENILRLDGTSKSKYVYGLLF